MFFMGGGVDGSVVMMLNNETTSEKQHFKLYFQAHNVPFSLPTSIVESKVQYPFSLIY